MKKAQVTLFIILGLFLVLVVGGISYASFQVATEQDEETVRQQDEVQDAISQFDSFFTSCVRDEVSERVTEVIQRGGVRYTDEGGAWEAVEGETFLEVDGERIPIFLERNSTCSEVQREPPNYPMENATIDGVSIQYSTTCIGLNEEGPFGKVTLPKWCYAGTGSTLRGEYTDSVCSRAESQDKKNKTTQFNLEREVDKSIETCSEAEDINQSGTNFELVQEPNSTVIYQEDGTLFLSDFEIVASIRGGEPEVARTSLDISFPYSIANLLTTKRSFIIRDIARGFMDGSSPALDGTTLDFTTQKQGSFTVVTLNDTERTLNGEPIYTSFAVPNRPPMLDPVSFDSGNFLFGGRPLLFSPTVKDPDQDPVSVELSGLGADFEPAFQGSCLWDFDDPNLIENCGNEADISDSEWTYDSEQDTYTYIPPANQTGAYTVTIRAVDSHGLYDEQTKNVYLLDVDDPDITMYSLKQEHEVISREDPLTITWDAQGTLIQEFEITIHEIRNGNNETSTSRTEQVTIEPTEIQNIESRNNITIITTQDYELDQFGNITNTRRNELDVVDCVPINTNSNVNSAPYHAQPDSLPAHTCCTQQNTIREESATCFEQEFDGAGQNIRTELEQLQNQIDQNPNVDQTFSYNLEDQQDYEVTYTHNCDGQRGNICGGDISLDINER